MPAGYRAQALALAEKDKWLPLVHKLLLHSDASSDDEDEAEASPFVALFNRAFVCLIHCALFSPHDSWTDSYLALWIQLQAKRSFP